MTKQDRKQNTETERSDARNLSKLIFEVVLLGHETKRKISHLEDMINKKHGSLNPPRRKERKQV